jgi:hypothetical protein
MPKGKSEAVNQRRADNAITKRKITKRQIMADKAIHRKLHIEEHELHTSSLWNHKQL